ncbi:MAG: HAD family hydrolase [Chloroflexi bacterium]|nr:MAG: HAD family hydrolase [Chloroflexota bacterium]
MESRWVALDVGETLIDESRVWSVWAQVLGIPRLTLMAALGAEVALGEDHVQAFDLVGVPDWRDHWEEVERVYGGFTADDCYPDALPAVQELCARGYPVPIVANQPARRTPELRAIGFDPDVMAMSDEMGVHKPDPAFFSRALELMGVTDASSVAYVGDRVDNDVLPSAACGMRAIWIRRGPWGVIQELPEEARADTMVVATLSEMVSRIDDAWG